MHRSLLWLSCLFLLAGCQNLPIEQDYDTQRDFSRYQSWQWAEPAVQFRPDSPLLRSDLTTQRIRQATAEQLLQRGLRESPTADLKVQASLVVEQRQQHISSGYASSYWGYPWGYWARPWKPAPSTIRWQPCNWICSTPATASWSGAAA